jgi:RNA polymerase sigma factor (sigma-70 family)
MKTFFEAHIWPLKSRLYRMAYLWLKDQQLAQDVLQQVFERAWLKREELQVMDNPTGWMVKCLKNESLQQYRKLKKTVSIEGIEIYSIEEDSPEEKEQQLRLVFQFVDTLPEKQKDIFILREVEGLTYEEIADYLEISMDQVKVNLHRARLLLKKYFIERK